MKIYTTKTGIKVGSRGRVINNVDAMKRALMGLSKGEARKMRKTAYAAGFRALASAPVGRFYLEDVGTTFRKMGVTVH